VALFDDRSVSVTVRDRGCGIPDVALARQPLFTTNTDGERSGMGFSVMETFTDRLSVRSRVGAGTTVTMRKRLS
jgi:stage II sporulation protein AB (anti-sigma F factor)